MKPSNLIKLKNLGNDFMTITGGFVRKGGVVSVREWEAKLWLKTKNVEEVIEPTKSKKSK